MSKKFFLEELRPPCNPGYGPDYEVADMKDVLNCTPALIE